MAVTPYTKVSSASLAGLVTDGNALMTTEQSNLDESNYEILRDGTRRRRRPIVQETNGALTFLGSSAGSLRSSYIWQTPSFRDNYSILCEENNGEVRFYSIDHDTPEYLRQVEVSQDRLRLELWGNRVDGFDPDLESPCTYTEGNGSLYIFNPRTGTIRVDLLRDNSLRMTAIGTWIRDYRGASEETEIDFRKPQVQALTQYDTSMPYWEATEEVQLTSEIGRARAYNLSNSGWDGKAVHQFMEQSSEGVDDPSLWPATTDRYLAGRQIAEDGLDEFSFSQLTKSKDNKSMPPLGARIGSSEFGPGGSLVGYPTKLQAFMDELVPGIDTTYRVQVTFNERQSHYDTPLGTDDWAAFVHSLSFVVEKDGRQYQAGASGVYDAAIVTDGKTSIFNYQNAGLSGYSMVGLPTVYLHPAPEYFPHLIKDNGNGFDYRTYGRRPASGAFFAGRLWQTADNHNRVYFSQILETRTSDSPVRGVALESLCFAAADPTSGEDNSVVASDGGYINTNDSGTHYGLETLGDSLLLLTDRGIWAVRPGSSGSFSASNYTFIKVVGAEVLGTKAFVSTGDKVHVATDEGILSLGLQSTSFGNTSVVVERLLDNKLMQGYEDIVKDWPNPAGSYDPESRTIRWLFRPDGDVYPTDIGQPVLSLSMYHNAWYKYTLGADSRVFDTVVLPYTARTETYNKFRYLIGGESSADSNVFLTGWGVEVDLGEEGTGDWIQDGLITGELFADYRPLQGAPDVFRDPIPAFMLTNHMVPGQGINWSQINYIVVHNRNVTKTWRDVGGGIVRPSVDGGTLLSIRWDWMDQNSTGKWSDPYQTYRYRRSYLPTGNTEENTYGEPVLVHKMKLRGRGREFRLYFESDDHNDSHIEGWAYQGYILNGV